MAVEVYEFALTIPAGTAKAAGFSLPMAMPTRKVDQIDVRVPPGPRGEVGWGIGAGGTIVLPQGGGSFFVMDDQFRPFVLDDAITSGAWVFFGYNTGTFNHTIYVTFHTSLPYAVATAAAGSSPAPITGETGTTGGTPPAGGTTPPPAPPPPVIPPAQPPPPVIPPGLGALPLELPPTLPTAPGQAGPSIDTEVDELLIGAGTSGQVWLLDERGYSQVQGQDDLSALLGAGVPGVNVSDATHQQLLRAAGFPVTVSLGAHTLRGTLTLTRGTASHQVTAGR